MTYQTYLNKRLRLMNVLKSALYHEDHYLERNCIDALRLLEAAYDTSQADLENVAPRNLNDN